MDISILCESFCEYSLSMKGYSHATIRRYRFVINCFIKFTQIQDLSQVSEKKVHELFFYGRTERKWSVNTYLVYRNSLMVFFQWCVKRGYIEKNPILEIEIPKAERKIPSKLTKQDAFRLLDIVHNYPYDYKFLRHRNHAVFSMFIFAGLRRQELLKLKYADVDLENFTIFVRQGKGNKDRIIPMSTTLAQTLKKYIEERKRLNRTCPEFFVSLSKYII